MNSKTTPGAGTCTGEPPCSPCQCVNWCEINHIHRFLTGHHEGCPHSPKALDKALELIAELARGIELWGAEEDGIYPEAWEAYRKAKALQGVFLPPANAAGQGRRKPYPEPAGSALDSDEPEDREERCDSCGETSHCLMRGLCPPCYELNGGTHAD